MTRSIAMGGCSLVLLACVASAAGTDGEQEEVACMLRVCRDAEALKACQAVARPEPPLPVAWFCLTGLGVLGMILWYRKTAAELEQRPKLEELQLAREIAKLVLGVQDAQRTLKDAEDRLAKRLPEDIASLTESLRNLSQALHAATDTLKKSRGPS